MAEEQVREETPAVRRYAIDREWFPAQLRDFVHLAQDRMCPESQARLGTAVEERAPRSDAAGRVAFETRRTRYGDDPFAVIAECCSQQPGYRNPRLSLMEIAFRLFLANHNQPLTLEDLTQQVLDWVRSGDGRIITPAVMERLVLADDFYGIRPVAEAVPAQPTP